MDRIDVPGLAEITLKYGILFRYCQAKRIAFTARILIVTTPRSAAIFLGMFAALNLSNLFSAIGFLFCIII